MTKINRVHICLLEIISRQYLCQSTVPFIGSNLTSSPHLEHKNVVSVISTQTTCVIKRVRRTAYHEVPNYINIISCQRIFYYVSKTVKQYELKNQRYALYAFHISHFYLIKLKTYFWVLTLFISFYFLFLTTIRLLKWKEKRVKRNITNFLKLYIIYSFKNYFKNIKYQM